ncbi:MAG: PIN domain-containing protein [Burkholderiales bacterium]
MRIFLDANALFSAARSDGSVRQLLALLTKADHECCVDGFVVEEARRNLAAKAPDGLAVLSAMLSRMRLTAAQAVDSDLEAKVPLPGKDRPVLAAAIRQGCSALITGDLANFGPLYGKTIEGVTIYSPRMIAETLL